MKNIYTNFHDSLASDKQPLQVDKTLKVGVSPKYYITAIAAVVWLRAEEIYWNNSKTFGQ